MYFVSAAEQCINMFFGIFVLFVRWKTRLADMYISLTQWLVVAF